MTDISNYADGKIIRDTKLALFFTKFVNVPIIGFFVGKGLLMGTKKYAPVIINMKEASEMISKSKKCAVGERICKAVRKDSEFTESVFLDDLAEGLVNAGKANYAAKKSAISLLAKYSRSHALILSNVDGKPLGICASSKDDCVFLNMSRKRLKVFRERQKNT